MSRYSSRFVPVLVSAVLYAGCDRAPPKQTYAEALQVFNAERQELERLEAAQRMEQARHEKYVKEQFATDEQMRPLLSTDAERDAWHEKFSAALDESGKRYNANEAVAKKQIEAQRARAFKAQRAKDALASE